MAGHGPFVLTVHDRREGRLLRIRECATEAAMAELALEEQDHFARFPHVQVECHWGLGRDEVLAQFRARLVPDAPAAPAARPPLLG